MGILIGSVGVLNCKDYDCWDFYTNPMSALHKYIWKSDGNENGVRKRENISIYMTNKMYVFQIINSSDYIALSRVLRNGLTCAPETEILIDQDSEDSHEKNGSIKLLIFKTSL